MKAPNLQRDGFWYVLVFGSAHTWITYTSRSAVLGIFCILIWLILLALVHYEIQRKARADKTFPEAWTRMPPQWEAQRQRAARRNRRAS